MRRSMFARLAGLLAPVMLFACQLSAAAPTPTPLPSATASLTASATSTATASPTLTLTPTQTATPTLTATATPTFTPSATDTQTPTPDPLAGAVLQLSDLPAGFSALSDADRAQLHLSDDDITRGYGKAFTSARLHNAAAFAYAASPNFQIVLAYLFYPLSIVEEGSLDLALSDPALFQKAFVTGAGTAPGAAGAKFTTRALPGMDKFGSKSAGVTVIITAANGVKVRTDTVVVRRGLVFEVYNALYPDKTVPLVTLTTLVKALDARVAAVP